MDEAENTMDESDPEMLMEDDMDDPDSDDDIMLQLNDNDELTQQQQQRESELPQVSNLPTIDPEAWKEEVERLAPQLKVKNASIHSGVYRTGDNFLQAGPYIWTTTKLDGSSSLGPKWTTAIGPDTRVLVGSL